jgi:hypothetical protein
MGRDGALLIVPDICDLPPRLVLHVLVVPGGETPCLTELSQLVQPIRIS